MNNFAEMNAEYEKWFSHKPARSCVAVKALPKVRTSEKANMNHLADDLYRECLSRLSVSMQGTIAGGNSALTMSQVSHLHEDPGNSDCLQATILGGRDEGYDDYSDILLAQTGVEHAPYDTAGLTTLSHSTSSERTISG